MPNACTVTVHTRPDPEPVLPSTQFQYRTKGPSVACRGCTETRPGAPVGVLVRACRKETLLLQAAHTRHGQRAQFVGVDTSEGAEVAAAFLAKVGGTHPRSADYDAMLLLLLLLKHLRIPSVPVTVVVGADGAVVERHISAFEARDLDALLDRVANP